MSETLISLKPFNGDNFIRKTFIIQWRLVFILLTHLGEIQQLKSNDNCCINLIKYNLLVIITEGNFKKIT